LERIVTCDILRYPRNAYNLTKRKSSTGKPIKDDTESARARMIIPGGRSQKSTGTVSRGVPVSISAVTGSTVYPGWKSQEPRGTSDHEQRKRIRIVAYLTIFIINEYSIHDKKRVMI
jgi:hypothetical protein